MHQEILTKEQLELLPLIKSFKKDFYLVGGTAIALHPGHRRSVDFDLFSPNDLKRRNIKNTLRKYGLAEAEILYEDSEQLHLYIQSVKLTFYHFPHPISASVAFRSIMLLR